MMRLIPLLKTNSFAAEGANQIVSKSVERTQLFLFNKVSAVVGRVMRRARRHIVHDSTEVEFNDSTDAEP